MGGSEAGRITPFNRDTEQALTTLKKGAHLWKYGRRGKPKLCHFRLSVDERYLIWFSDNEEKNVKISSISEISRGQVNFQQQGRAENFHQSFSLVYRNGEKSLDLICKDKEQAECWYRGLKTLISGSHHHKVPTASLNGDIACSYLNSPVIYAQRKHLTDLIEGSTKLSQDVGYPLKVPQFSALAKKCSSDGPLLSPNIWSLSEQAPLSSNRSVVDYMLPPPQSAKSVCRMESTNSEAHRTSLSSVISSSSNGCLLDDNDALNDVLLWGEGIEGFILGGKTDQSPGFQAHSLLPKLLESAIALDVSSIACGGNHAALVTKKGEVFCWGKENGGRLGHKIDMDVPYPKIVEYLSDVNVEMVRCGESHTCALSNTGEVYVWGGTSHGFDCLPNDSRKSLWLPHRIPLVGVHISNIACGAWHTALISSSGMLFTFGEGTFGALGHGSLESILQPREVESLKGSKVKLVACGPWHTAAIVEMPNNHPDNKYHGGKLFTWGDSDKGKLGHSDKQRKLVPTFVVPLADYDFLQVSCGQMMTVALTVSGTALTMGSSVHGQLGNPLAKDGTISVVEGALKTEYIKEISSGLWHVAVLTSKGDVYTWGKGANGRLGLGDVQDKNSPCLVEGLKDRHVRSVTCGLNFTAVICRHKAISSTDQSVCSGCQMAFGFARKKHHCYNCGLTFCHACSSKKAMNASLAPNKSKHHRVCDRCFTHLRNSENFMSGQETPSSRHPSMMQKLYISNLKHQRPESAVLASQIFSPKVHGHEELKYFEGKNIRQGTETQTSAISFSCEPQRWGQVECPKNFDALGAVPEFSAMHSKKETKVTSPKRETGWHGAFPSPANPSFHGLEDVKITDSTGVLIEEVQRLRIEAKNLEEQCKMKEEKIQQYKEGIKETWSLASEEVAKCKAAKDVIKVLAARLKEMSEKFVTEKEQTVKKRVVAHAEIQENEYAQVLHHNLHATPSGNGRASPIHSSNDPLVGFGKAIQHNATALASDPKPEAADHSENNTTSRPEDGHPPFSEWVEQDEPGVYITFMALPNGQKDLKRVRFSRKRFSEREAETWWAENRSRVHYKYNVIGTVNT